MGTRTWKCRKCGERWPRVKRKCKVCGKLRPVRKTNAQKALVEPYEVWAKEFGEACNICGATQKPGGRRLHRDHEHSSGKRRGILCFKCNSGLRTYMTAAWLEKAAAYLRRAEGSSDG